jgi:transposase-like protein
MSKYSEERKASVVKKLLPPINKSIAEVSRQEGISSVTLYAWRKQTTNKSIAMSKMVKNADEWSAQAKLAVVIETAALSEIELSEYCRGKGIFVEQARAWRQAALDGQQNAHESRQTERHRARQESKQIKSLEKQLARKDKALAEAAALLMLSKKAEAIWGNGEEE